VIQRYAPLAQRHGSELILEASGELRGLFDVARVEQVLSNLLANALKFGSGKPVTVTLTVAGDNARIVVRDQGIGIAPADQRRIFDRFERAASDRHYGGLGLGLWISRRILEQLGGSISVSSQPGQGSAFTIELPLRAATQSAVG